ncbi:MULTISPECIES: pyridoxamine 5'-phosphate oxidase family protein [Nocardiaceae]|uniref:Pyridoxamine 5'-phosphate oxidase putative domain-containing protein n=1 Tax=Rhodococcoides corynebacterioides TaxID=53972 RepID=A0ABS2KU84_9NOCA|nr:MULTISPECIES: pyridoxamine 5'-phosphate oxidase family protein [Rhodococcus]MBM7415502.1 hypothetical protein [Rhodococcus corynebacterioides]MBP1117964.1 hypothetical protein [Rhodococcus sp. PvP016]
MRLARSEAVARLAARDHGVLCTVHATRGVDAVPCVFAADDGFIGVPVDRVKPKSTFRLQRERNLDADRRATLLVEQWDRDDWSQLWWVRASLRWEADPSPRQVDDLSAQLRRRFSQYVGEPFARIHVFRIIEVTGWAAR